jgi:hypothetical protein
VISFLGYPDIETLRNCCLYLHNFTKDLRLSWRLFGPLRATAVMRVLSLFLDSAKLDNDGVVRPDYPLHDSEGKELCHRFLRQGIARRVVYCVVCASVGRSVAYRNVLNACHSCHRM